MGTDLKVMENILNEEVVFYMDKNNPSEVYVEYKKYNGAFGFEKVQGQGFNDFLGFRYRELTGELVLPDFSALIAIVEQNVRYQHQNEVSIERRLVGTLKEGIIYFLSDERWRSVGIRAGSWKVGRSKKRKFLKNSADLPQVMPVAGGHLLSLIRPYVNMDDDDFKLFVVWMIQCFSKSSSHYAAILSSDKGTGKSTLTKLLREIVAPSLLEASLLPSNINELKNFLANTYLACFDNTAPLTTAHSNVLCAAITGTKEAKRKLYTDADQVIMNLHNVVVLNGIGIIPHKSDLSERSLLFELQKIKKTQRKTDADFWKAFETDKPRILGAVFDTLASAMKILPTLKPTKLDRMADAHKEMMAIARALDIPELEFQRIMDANIARRDAAYAENNPLVEAVTYFMIGKNKVNASSSKLYVQLRESLCGDTRFFPGSASSLTRKLNEERDALKEAGFSVSTQKKKDYNELTIQRIPQNCKNKKVASTVK